MRTFFIILFALLSAVNVKGQISPELNAALHDSLKPKDINAPSLKELCAIIDNTSLSLYDFSAEMESIALMIEKKLPVLKMRDEKIVALYTLMVFNYNFAGDENIKSEYGDLLLTTIGKNKKGYEKQYFNGLLIKANARSGDYDFEDAIDLINKALTEKSKIQNKNVVAGAYLTLSDIYKKIHLYNDALANLELATQTANKTSDYYNKYLKHYAFLKKSELNILQYLYSKEDRYLKTAKELLNKKSNHDLKDRWLSLWYLQNAYISYLENNYSLSQQQFDKASDIPFEDKVNGAIACRFATLKGLLLIKNKKEAAGVQLLEQFYSETTNEFYYEISLKELYNYYKNEKNYNKANFYLEKILETKTLQDNFKYKGAVFTANKKYDVREKQIEISRLQDQAIIKRNQNYLILFGVLLVSSLIISVLLFKNRENKIKQLKKEQEYAKNIKLMQEYLYEEETKMQHEQNELVKEQKVEIGQNLHNDVLGSMVALNYLIEDYINNASNPHEKSSFQEIRLETMAIYTELRDFSHSLTNEKSLSQHLNLVAYVENIQNRFSEIGLLTITFNGDKEQVEKKLSSTVKSEVYYLIKESVSNTIKHANASQLTIEISFEELLCIVEITDNGQGVQLKQETGVGLLSIKERIEKINGKVELKSDLSGTVVTAKIPVYI